MKPITSNLQLRPLRTRSLSGHTLLWALAVITIIVGISAVAMSRTNGTARMGLRATNFAAAERAADGVIEYAYGVWKTATVQKDAPLSSTLTNDAAVLNGAGPSMSGFTYTSALKIQPVDAYGNATQTPTPVRVSVPGYTGWYGHSHNYIATVAMKPVGGLFEGQTVSTGAKRIFQYIGVPLFQSMYFFEHDLEIYRPAPMSVDGLIHSNSRLLISGSSDQTGVELDLRGKVSYAGGSSSQPGVTYTEPPIGGPAWAGFSVSSAPSYMEAPTYAGGGASQQLAAVQRYEPLGKQPTGLINTTDSNPNNDGFHEFIERPVAGFPDPPEFAKRRLSNKAGIVISINGTTATVTTQNGASLTATQITTLRTALTSKNSFYDAREGKNIDAANIDVSKITSVINSGAGNFNGAIYIEDVTPRVTGDLEPKTIRLQKGGVLPNTGLTIASPNPVYVHGDFNTGTTTSPTAVEANLTGNPTNNHSPVVSGYDRKPAAIVADAVMFLSNAWADSLASSSVSSRVASNTTYNTAILAGFTPSGWDPDGSGAAAPYGYSGGANNFPRFLETWTGKTCTYFGSMVELYESKTFTGRWDTGVIYRPPTRRWNYDTLFNTTTPPGSIDGVAIVRGGFSKF